MTIWEQYTKTALFRLFVESKVLIHVLWHCRQKFMYLEPHHSCTKLIEMIQEMFVVPQGLIYNLDLLYHQSCEDNYTEQNRS